MSLSKCSNGHTFESEEYGGACPYCNSSLGQEGIIDNNSVIKIDEDSDKTVLLTDIDNNLDIEESIQSAEGAQLVEETAKALNVEEGAQSVEETSKNLNIEEGTQAVEDIDKNLNVEEGVQLVEDTNKDLNIEVGIQPLTDENKPVELSSPKEKEILNSSSTSAILENTDFKEKKKSHIKAIAKVVIPIGIIAIIIVGYKVSDELKKTKLRKEVSANLITHEKNGDEFFQAGTFDKALAEYKAAEEDTKKGVLGEKDYDAKGLEEKIEKTQSYLDVLQLEKQGDDLFSTSNFVTANVLFERARTYADRILFQEASKEIKTKIDESSSRISDLVNKSKGTQDTETSDLVNKSKSSQAADLESQGDNSYTDKKYQDTKTYYQEAQQINQELNNQESIARLQTKLKNLEEVINAAAAPAPTRAPAATPKPVTTPKPVPTPDPVPTPTPTPAPTKPTTPPINKFN